MRRWAAREIGCNVHRSAKNSMQAQPSNEHGIGFCPIHTAHSKYNVSEVSKRFPSAEIVLGTQATFSGFFFWLYRCRKQSAAFLYMLQCVRTCAQLAGVVLFSNTSSRYFCLRPALALSRTR